MRVTLRPYRSGGWEVDITIRLPDGSQYRERKRASRFSKSAAQRWAEDRGEGHRKGDDHGSSR
jgi:hypothetical protein